LIEVISEVIDIDHPQLHTTGRIHLIEVHNRRQTKLAELNADDPEFQMDLWDQNRDLTRTELENLFECEEHGDFGFPLDDLTENLRGGKSDPRSAEDVECMAKLVYFVLNIASCTTSVRSPGNGVTFSIFGLVWYEPIILGHEYGALHLFYLASDSTGPISLEVTSREIMPPSSSAGDLGLSRTYLRRKGVFVLHEEAFDLLQHRRTRPFNEVVGSAIVLGFLNSESNLQRRTALLNLKFHWQALRIPTCRQGVEGDGMTSDVPAL
jgi:hypothetical protein